MNPRLVKKKKDKCNACHYEIGPKGPDYHDEFLCSTECVCGAVITRRTSNLHLDCEQRHQEHERQLHAAAAEYKRKQDYFFGGMGPMPLKARSVEVQGGLPSLGKNQ
jgi:hypothetical protein